MQESFPFLSLSLAKATGKNDQVRHMALRRVPFVWVLMVAILMVSSTVSARRSILNMNVIDKCWRTNPRWYNHRYQLASCSVGYTGKMRNNVGKDVINYEVIDPTDDAMNPKPGTLRYAMTHVKGKVWVTFRRDMIIRLQKPLLVRSFSTIDGRGANVHIAGGACLVLQRVTNVIIHGLRIHDCKAQRAGPVMGPEGKIVQLGAVDGDAIRLVTSSKIWLDHNTLSDCEDGLIDVTRGSTGVTISNNWFKFQNKVMLLGHDDGYLRDRNMKVTVAFNHFGPHCQQRMPRIRFGYAHVVNNLYLGWGLYAIGGSMNPSVKSQANLFIAPNKGKKEVIWREHTGRGMSVNVRSVADVFENGASFQAGGYAGVARPNYTKEQSFPVSNARTVRALTKSAGALKCSKVSRC